MQPATVSTGRLNAGVATLGVSVVATWPASESAADAEIRNRIVPPGATLIADAETVTAGVAAWCVVIRPVAEGLGAGVAGEVLWWWLVLHHVEEGAGLAVPLAVGAADAVGSVAGVDGVAAGLDGVTGADDAAGPGDAGVDGAAGWLDTAAPGAGAPGRPDDGDEADGDGDGDGDGATAADDATAMTMTVTPPKMRKKPVARISVTGRARMNRMRTPVSWHRVGRDRALRGIRHIWGHGLALGATNCERAR